MDKNQIIMYQTEVGLTKIDVKVECNKEEK